MTCPECGSDDWKSASLVYKAGLADIDTNTTAIGAGVGLGSNGAAAGVGVGVGSTSGKQQTKLSLDSTPPEEPKDNQGTIYWVIAIVLALMIGAQSDLIGGIVLIGSIILWQSLKGEIKKDYGKRLGEYKRKLRQWEATRVCQRCGLLYLPDDFVEGLDTEGDPSLQDSGEATETANLSDSNEAREPDAQLKRTVPHNDDAPLSREVTTSNVIEKRILAILDEKKTDNLYVGNGIPEEKLKNAINSFPIRASSKVLGLIDTTIFGSCKTGMAITDQGLVWNNGLGASRKKTNMSWDELLGYRTQMVATEIGVTFEENVGLGIASGSMKPADALELFVALADEYRFAKNHLEQKTSEKEGALYERSLIASFALMTAADGEAKSDEIEMVSAFFAEEEAIHDKQEAFSEFKKHIDKLTSSHAKSKALFNLQTEKFLAIVRKLEDKDLISRLEVMLEGMLSAAGGNANEDTVEMMRRIISNIKQ
jgi:hypothetical protein